MPTPTKVCVLARHKSEAIAWCRENDVNPRKMIHPLSADRVYGVYFAKIIELPSFERASARHAIRKALQRSMQRRFVKTKVQWIKVDAPGVPTEPKRAHAEAPTGTEIAFKLPELGFETPEGELPGQTTIEEQIAAHEVSAAGDAANEGILSKTDSQARRDSEGTLSESVAHDPEPAAEPAKMAAPKPTPPKKAAAKPGPKAKPKPITSNNLDDIFEGF